MDPDENRPRRHTGAIALIIFLVLVFVIAVVSAVGSRKLVEKRHDPHVFRSLIPDPEKAANFTLTDPDGNPQSLDSLKGSVVLLTFGFTHCPNICPNTLGNLAKIYRGLSPEEQNRVKVLFVTLDPSRDTREVMKDYVPFFDPSFVGLTGTEQEIAKVAKDYGVSFRRSPLDKADAAEYSIDHSTYTYLIDPAGKTTILYRLEGAVEERQPIQDIQQALK